MSFDFGKGFDERNLRYMRQFYLLFSIWNTVCSKLTWSHYRTLIKIEEQHIREFYMQEAINDNLYNYNSFYGKVSLYFASLNKIFNCY